MNAHIHIPHSLAASNRMAYGDQTVSLVEDSLVLVGCQAGCVPQVCTTRRLVIVPPLSGSQERRACETPAQSCGLKFQVSQVIGMAFR
jgi:hypothetical protein